VPHPSRSEGWGIFGSACAFHLSPASTTSCTSSSPSRRRDARPVVLLFGEVDQHERAVCYKANDSERWERVTTKADRLLPFATGAIPCAAFLIVAAWKQRRTVQTLKLATAASSRSRSLGTRPSRARELAFVAVCLTHAEPIRSRQLAAARTSCCARRSVTLAMPRRDAALCRTIQEILATSHSTRVTRPFLPVTARRVELPLTLSKQRTAMRSTRHSNEGAAGARLEAKN
jgi:hypothetical protein